MCSDMAADWSFLGFNLATQPSTDHGSADDTRKKHGEQAEAMAGD